VGVDVGDFDATGCGIFVTTYASHRKICTGTRGSRIRLGVGVVKSADCPALVGLGTGFIAFYTTSYRLLMPTGTLSGLDTIPYEGTTATHAALPKPGDSAHFEDVSAASG